MTPPSAPSPENHSAPSAPAWVGSSPSQPLFIVVSGPSGVGKDSVLDYMRELDLPLHFVITATSRPPRPHETDGVDYFFYTRERFLEMVEAGEFIEHALVYKDYKGIPKSQVREAFATGRDVIVRVDVQGAATIQNLYPQALLIFLTTPTVEELIERLKKRRTETETQFNLRVQTAWDEMQVVENFDYIVQNRDGELRETVETIQAIIAAEHHKVDPRKVVL
ncbi:MAG: guanylate kinase [Anaerolineales bacterium]|nr:guanylate kinase [Anaerolineales bacterium]